MTKRFAGLTPAQQRVFEQIATGNDAGHHPATLAALVRKGAVAEREEKHVEPGFGTFTIKRYDFVLTWHMAWCRWCAENVDEEVLAITPKTT